MFIREAQWDDREAVYQLVCQLEDYTFDREKITILFERNLDNPTIRYICAELDGVVIGFGSLYINELLHHCGKVGEIQELVVDSNYRDQGIGGLLMDDLLKWADQEGCVQVEVACNQIRTSAHGFYFSKGFINSHYKFVKEF